MKKLTTEEFISKSKKAHGNKYDYSKVEYIGNKTKVIIVCPEHGEFEQIPESHLKGCGCVACGGTKKLDTQEFILRAKKIHGDKYNYSKVEYVNSKTKVIIICPEHGEFSQEPISHLGGCGCVECVGLKQLTTEEFISRAIKIHGNRYNYSKVEYINAKTKITIICPEHGEFEQNPHNHIRQKHGCSVCSGTKKLDTQEFIAKAKEVHGDKYNYSKVEYTNAKTKITIICPEHGEFEQSPHNHINHKHGCSSCAGNQKSDTVEFIAKAKEVHGDKYNYSKVEYIDNKTKVIIICPEHGEFQPTPNEHLTGNGCAICGNLAVALKLRSTKNEFVAKARQIHRSKYDYSKVTYTNCKIKTTIICPEHGEFKQSPSEHLAGRGCPTCKESKGEKSVRLYLEEQSIIHRPQFKFKNSEISSSRFDFVVEKGLIEYHGIQHYVPCSFGSKKKNGDILNLKNTIRSDLRKEKWCQENKIPLFIIPFWDYDRIPDILDDYFANRIPVISEPPDIVKKYEPMRNKIRERFKGKGAINLALR